MSDLDHQEIQCPYCWQTITLAIDYSVSRQHYVEDCHICCHPMLIEVEINGADIWVNAQFENA